MYLGLGVLFAATSLLWAGHLLLSVILPAHYEVVDYVLVELSNNQLSLISFLIYCYMTLYLLLAAFNGNAKLGMRFGVSTYHVLMYEIWIC